MNDSEMGIEQGPSLCVILELTIYCPIGKFYCLRQVHLAENLPRATHTQNRVETT